MKIFSLAVLAIVLVAFTSFVFSTFEQIDAGERGIVLHWGEYSRTLDPGFHFVTPISEEIHVMNVRVQKYETKASAASKDLQTVDSVVVLNYHLDPKGVGKIWQEVGREYEINIIRPAIQEALKAGSALFTAEELISKRTSVKDKITEDISGRLGRFNLIVDEFSIVDFGFRGEFNDAIEAKQVEDQKAQKAENELRRIKLEAQQDIEKAKAEAESTRLQVEALKNSSEIIELRKVEAMLEAARRWDGKLPVNVYGSSPLPLLNLGK